MLLGFDHAKETSKKKKRNDFILFLFHILFSLTLKPNA